MTSPQILAQLGHLHLLMRDLLRSVPPADANRRFEPRLASLGWYLGRSVFREAFWLREILAGDRDLTDRVRPLFSKDANDLQDQCNRLPPPEHLLRWAAEIQDEHLRRLATPGAFAANSLLQYDRLQWFLLQEAARDYELMLMVMHARAIQHQNTGYEVQQALTAKRPRADLVAADQGHFRIGSRDQPNAYDNELPPQAVELSGFRIARQPASNTEYLAFIDAGGYENDAFWSEEGRRWQRGSKASAPLHWRRDRSGHWYGIGLNGAVDLQPDQPVSGLAYYEAEAFATWVAGLGEELSGAVLQHEYQWEVAARSGHIQGIGQVWEWCANPFHPYPQFRPFPDVSVSEADFGGDQYSLRGASIHTQRCRRRASFRNRGAPGDRFNVAGVRLVFPPD